MVKTSHAKKAKIARVGWAILVGFGVLVSNRS
jgi:hypothetical protein